jgi:hypothetical protein
MFPLTVVGEGCHRSVRGDSNANGADEYAFWYGQSGGGLIGGINGAFYQPWFGGWRHAERRRPAPEEKALRSLPGVFMNEVAESIAAHDRTLGFSWPDLRSALGYPKI